MSLTEGSHRLGPEHGSLVVKTYREGVAAKVGHDLVIEVTRWEATLDVAAEPERSTIAFEPPRIRHRSRCVRACAASSR